MADVTVPAYLPFLVKTKESFAGLSPSISSFTNLNREPFSFSSSSALRPLKTPFSKDTSQPRPISKGERVWLGRTASIAGRKSALARIKPASMRNISRALLPMARIPRVSPASNNRSHSSSAWSGSIHSS